MKVYIVKHYWKDGENATWESHENIDKKIFEYLKKNYHSFVENRQNTIKEGNHYIYPCYEDGVDIYSRKLTNITFFVSKSEIDEELCNKEYHDLEISLAGKRNKLIFYLVGLVVIVGLLFGYYYSNKQKSLDKKSTTNSSEKEEINIEINKEFQDINLSVKDINLTFITNKRKIIDKKIEGKEKLLNYENNCSVNKLRDFISINEKIQDLDTCIKNKEEIDKCKKDLKEIQIEYKDKNFIKQSIELLNIYIESLVKKKLKDKTMNQEQKSDNIHLTKLKKIKWSPSVKELTFRDLNYQWIEFCNKSNKEITVNQEAILSTEKPKNSFAKKTILTLVTLVGIGGAGFFAYNLQIKSNAPLEQLEPKEIDYTKFIDDWNKQVQHNTVKKEFLLNRNSNDKMIEQLENWMKNFYIPKVTESLEYNQFLEKNKFGKPTYFNTSMSRDEIREFLKKTTKEKVMSKIVKKVLMMNDMEIWKKLGK